jgi:hypothetical protein
MPARPIVDDANPRSNELAHRQYSLGQPPRQRVAGLEWSGNASPFTAMEFDTTGPQKKKEMAKKKEKGLGFLAAFKYEASR